MAESPAAARNMSAGGALRLLKPPGIKLQAFICGCGHSGTTLIANILSAHPNAHVPLRETYIFQDDTLHSQWRHVRLLWEGALTGKRIFIEKSPLHIKHVDSIRAAVRGARFVMPVRDGRDVIASIVRRKGHAQAAAERWIKENSIVLAERERPDVLVYRHEDLVRDAASVVRKICKFLDIEYKDNLLEYHKQERLWFGQTEIQEGNGREGEGHHRLRNWQVNQPIFDSGGRWRSELSDKDIDELVSGRGRHLMEAFGYL
jgi:hypothetical protein